MKRFKNFITESVADSTIEHELPILLANLHVLSIKAHNFHWNVRGVNFGPLHELFDTIHEIANDHIDDVAERMRALRLVTPGSMQEFLNLTTISETTGQSQSAKNMLLDLHTDLQDVSEQLNTIVSDSNDEGTKNLMSGMIESIDKYAWIVRSHVTDDEVLEDNDVDDEDESTDDDDDSSQEDEE